MVSMLYLHLKFAAIPVVSNGVRPRNSGYLVSVFDWNPSGVIGLVCHLLLIIGKVLDPTQELKIPFA